MGQNATASGTNSTAFGRDTEAQGNNSIAMGVNVLTSGLSSFAAGFDTQALGDFSTAMGIGTEASAEYSIAMGSSSEASGDRAIAIGYQTEASGNYSTAMGTFTKASGPYSTAIGDSTEASGNYSTAMGRGAKASGGRAVAMGSFSEASGDYSTAMGRLTEAHGTYSTAMGYQTRATSMYSTAIGYYNVGGGSPDTWVSSEPLFEIGIGTLDWERSNALTVLKNGNIGIGTHTPQELLHISGGRIRIGSETIEDTGNNRLSFNADLLPDVNEGTQLGNSSFRWLGLWAVDGTINTSDRRDKSNIRAINYGLNEVLKMNPVSFNWKNRKDQDTKLGLIAQDLLKLVPEVVKTHEWQTTSDDENVPLEKVELDRLGVYYSDLIPVLIKAIQEQQEVIDSQNQKIDTIEMKLNALLEANHITITNPNKE
jgi:hypothetical protein